MIGVVVAALMLAVLVYVVKLTSVPGRDDGLMRLLVLAYMARMVIQLFSREFSFFSHGGGGDYRAYEYWALELNRLWSHGGIEYISAADDPAIGPTSLPPNLFAVIIALNGGEATPFGCTAVVACLAVLTGLNAYHLGLDIGAEPRRARMVVGLFLFSPAVLLYTSDMYKDGLVLFAGSLALASGIRLAGRFSFLHLGLGAFALVSLWYIRFYLVFLCSAPLFVGLAGLRAKSIVRPIFGTLLLGAGFAFLVATTDVMDSVSETANATFEGGTDRRVLDANAASGSGVTFSDGGNPFGAMGPKLAYQLFAPFPWAGGSVGFHIGKIDTILWYYLAFRALKAAKVLWGTERNSLLMLLSFIVPTTFLYATSFANVGLSLRQRLIVVLMTGVLAMRSWSAEQRDKEPATNDTEPAHPALRRTGAWSGSSPRAITRV